MSRPRIGIDADEVLYDFSGHGLRIINRIRGTSFTKADVTDFFFKSVLGDDPAVEREFRSRLDVERTAMQLDVLPDARELLGMVEEYGELWIVTSPMHTNMTWAYDRLHRLGQLGVDRHRVHFASDKSSFDGILLVDDYAPNLQAWEDGAMPGSERHGVLWERPWSGPWAGWRCVGENRVGQLEEMIQFELARRGLR